MFRSIETRPGYETLKDPKTRRCGRKRNDSPTIRRAYPVFLAGKVLAQGRQRGSWHSKQRSTPRSARR
jgi:hypothetical protein